MQKIIILDYSTGIVKIVTILDPDPCIDMEEFLYTENLLTDDCYYMDLTLDKFGNFTVEEVTISQNECI